MASYYHCSYGWLIHHGNGTWLAMETQMKVFHALQQLLEFKGYCSYNEVSQVAGLNRLRVLEILNQNKKFLKFHPNKKDRIVGVTNAVIIDNLMKEGKIFWIEKENYGIIEVIRFQANEALRKKLEKPYICGGMGDNYTIMCIENTEDNLKTVYEAGLRTHDFIAKQEPVIKHWIESSNIS